jgi:hypothetical protein
MARIVQGKIADWLQSVGEDEAADWFQKYWCGPRGNWTIADSGVGGVPNGCGPESKWEKLTRVVCGNSGKTKSLKVEIFVSGLVKFIADISKETAIEQMKEFKTHRFLNAPVPTSAMWESVFLTDVRILLHSQIQSNREMQKIWKGFVDRLPLLLPERPAATVCERIDAYTAECGLLSRRLFWLWTISAVNSVEKLSKLQSAFAGGSIVIL